MTITIDDTARYLDLANCTYVGKQSVGGPNWKLAYDGYLDFYHLPILHKDTFGTAISNKAVYDAWGPHQRVSSPVRRSASIRIAHMTKPATSTGLGTAPGSISQPIALDSPITLIR